MNHSPVSPDLLSHKSASRVRSLPLSTVTFVLLALAALVDWATGPEAAFSVLYLIPVGLMSWQGGRWHGLVAAGVGGAIWLWIELVTNTGYSSTWIPYWNGLVRLTVFYLVAVLISEVAERKRTEAALDLNDGGELLQRPIEWSRHHAA